MPYRDDWQDRIKAVALEFQAVRIATDQLMDAARRDSTILKGRVEPRDLARASNALEGTYLIRMFAQFETGLRLYWNATRATSPPMRDLLDGVAAMRLIPDDPHKLDVHAVRVYRNSLLHECEDEAVEPIPLAIARSHLCRFFSFLPRQWPDA